jgi:hypothetical protein
MTENRERTLNAQDDCWAPLDYPGGLLDDQWEQSTWEGLPQLKCIHCPWDTLDGIEAAREHARVCPRCQPIEEPKAPSSILIADKNWMPDKNIRA